MATHNNTITGGGTVGHIADAAKAYVRTSKVWDTADGGAGGGGRRRRRRGSRKRGVAAV